MTRNIPNCIENRIRVILGHYLMQSSQTLKVGQNCCDCKHTNSFHPSISLSECICKDSTSSELGDLHPFVNPLSEFSMQSKWNSSPITGNNAHIARHFQYILHFPIVSSHFDYQSIIHEIHLPKQFSINLQHPNIMEFFQLFLYLYHEICNIGAAKVVARRMTFEFPFCLWTIDMIETIALFFRDVDPHCAIPYFDCLLFHLDDHGRVEFNSSCPFCLEHQSLDSLNIPQASCNKSMKKINKNARDLPLHVAPGDTLNDTLNDTRNNAIQTKMILKSEGILVDMPSVDSLSRMQRNLLDFFKCLFLSGSPIQTNEHGEIIIMSYNLNQLTRDYFKKSSHLNHYLQGTIFHRACDYSKALQFYKKAAILYPEFTPYQNVYMTTARKIDHVTSFFPSLKYLRPKELIGKSFSDLAKEIQIELEMGKNATNGTKGSHSRLIVI